MLLSCTPVVVRLLLVNRSDAQTIAQQDPSALVGAMLIVISKGQGFRIRQVDEIVGGEIRFTTEESVNIDAIAEEIDLYWRHEDPWLIRDLCTELWAEGQVKLEQEAVKLTVERLRSAIGEKTDPQMLQEMMQELMSMLYDKDLHDRATASWAAHEHDSKINEHS